MRVMVVLSERVGFITHWQPVMQKELRFRRRPCWNIGLLRRNCFRTCCWPDQISEEKRLICRGGNNERTKTSFKEPVEPIVMGKLGSPYGDPWLAQSFFLPPNMPKTFLNINRGLFNDTWSMGIHWDRKLGNTTIKILSSES